MAVRVRRIVFTAALLAAVAVAAVSAAPTSFSRIVVFGTSLSDSGSTRSACFTRSI